MAGEELKKAWEFINNAQKEVSLRFTGNSEAQKYVRKAYDKLQEIKDEIQIVAKFKGWIK